MTPETRQPLICDQYPQCTIDRNQLKLDMKRTEHQLESCRKTSLAAMKNGKVSTKLFFWTLGLLIGSFLSLQGYSISKIENLSDDVISLRESMAVVKSTLVILKEDIQSLQRSKSTK